MLYVIISFPSSGSGFSSKPTTPTGSTPFIPPMGSPSRPHHLLSTASLLGRQVLEAVEDGNPKDRDPPRSQSPAPATPPCLTHRPGTDPTTTSASPQWEVARPAQESKHRLAWVSRRLDFNSVVLSVVQRVFHLIFRGENLMSLNKCFLCFCLYSSLSGTKPKVSDANFDDLLSGQGFAGTKEKKGPRTIAEMRKEEMAKEMDPEKIKAGACVSDEYHLCLLLKFL